MKEGVIFFPGEFPHHRLRARKVIDFSRLLNDHAARSSEDARAPDVATDELFEEVLLSYRLIFGQDDRSWKAFSRMAPLWEEQRGRLPWEATWDCDPMLAVLCGKSCTDEEARQVYDDIDANEPANYYDSNTEFPFFGKRLLELQQLIKQYQPQDVRSLWNDRRDVAAWYTLRTNQVRTLMLSCVDSRVDELVASDNFRFNHDFPHDLVIGSSGLAGNTSDKATVARSTVMKRISLSIPFKELGVLVWLREFV